MVVKGSFKVEKMTPLETIQSYNDDILSKATELYHIAKYMFEAVDNDKKMSSGLANMLTEVGKFATVAIMVSKKNKIIIELLEGYKELESVSLKETEDVATAS